MHIAYTPEQQALKDRLSEYFSKFITNDLLEEKQNPETFEGGGPVFRKKMKQMAEDGLLGLGWPKELGGEGIGPVTAHLYRRSHELRLPLPLSHC